MAIKFNFSQKAEIHNTGFSEKAEAKDLRLIQKDGNINVVKLGTNFWESFSLYHYILEVSNLHFALLVIGFYSLMNLAFAFIYLLIGINHLHGLISDGSFWNNFEEAYFFSAQTLTTVGYGRISPVGFLANTIASLEALSGILTLAIVTGLLYGRFVKPKAFIKFSENAVIRPFKNQRALMMRLAPTKTNRISQVHASINMMIEVEENKQVFNKFYSLPLELDFINSLYLSWTLVHPIDENSPLFNLSEGDLKKGNIQINVNLKAFDEGFSNTVLAHTNYIFEEIVYDHQFVKMTQFSEKMGKLTLDLKKLNQIEPCI